MLVSSFLFNEFLGLAFLKSKYSALFGKRDEARNVLGSHPRSNLTRNLLTETQKTCIILYSYSRDIDKHENLLSQEAEKLN